MQLPVQQESVFSDDSLHRFVERHFVMPKIKPTADADIEIISCEKRQLNLKKPGQAKDNLNYYRGNAYLVTAKKNGQPFQLVCTSAFYVEHPHQEDGICYIPPYSKVTGLHISAEAGGYRMGVKYKEYKGGAVETCTSRAIQSAPTHGCNAV